MVEVQEGGGALASGGDVRLSGLGGAGNERGGWRGEARGDANARFCAVSANGQMELCRLSLLFLLSDALHFFTTA